MSLFEPINRFGADEPEGQFWGYDVRPVEPIAAKLAALYQARQPLAEDPMLDFDERDLLAVAGEVGFAERHLEYRADIAPHAPTRWETFAATAFNPRIPTLDEAMAEALTPAEAEQFAAHLRPKVERGDGVFALAVASLWGAKT
jgi:hypothetical protein